MGILNLSKLGGRKDHGPFEVMKWKKDNVGTWTNEDPWNLLGYEPTKKWERQGGAELHASMQYKFMALKLGKI